MIEKYRCLYRIYLDMCRKQYNPEKPYKNLKNCIKTCEHSRWQLLGMLDLLQEVGELTNEEVEVETNKITKEFSSLEICGAYMEDGEVMVFAVKGEI